MKKSEDQIKLMEFIKSSFLNYKKLSSSFNLKFGNTCFHEIQAQLKAENF